MLEKYKKMGLAAAICMLLGVNATEAAVTLTFQQVGNDVTASWSGAYNLPSPKGVDFVGRDARVGDTYAYYGNIFGYSYTEHAGAVTPSGLSDLRASMYLGDNFGFSSGNFIVTSGTLYFPVGATGEYSPSGTFTFVNRTLSELGAGSFDNFVAFIGNENVGGNREIRFHTASIPEPSSIILIGLGSVALVFRRKAR